MSVSDEYEFVRISPDHFANFVSLVKDSFGTTTSIDEVRRLFNTSEFGVENIGFLAYHRESWEPAAFYGIFPCFAEVDGERILAAQSGSTMTHPNHRKRNLFVQAAEKTFELAKKEGIAFVYGLPNRYSYRGLMKLGWTHYENMIRYRVVVPTLPLGALGTKLSLVRRMHVWLFRKVSAKWRVPLYPLPSSVLEPGIGGSHRSVHSIRYKPEDDTHLMLKVGNSIAWINQINGQIGIGDLQLAEGEFGRVFRTLRLVAFLSGCNVIRTYVSPDTMLDRVFKENGFTGDTALPICYYNLARDVGPGRFKWVYGDCDTF